MLYWVAVKHNIHVPFSCFHGIDPNCQPPTVRLLLTQLSCLCFLFLVWNFSLGLLHKILGKEVWQSLDHAQTVPLEIHEIKHWCEIWNKKWWPEVQDLSQPHPATLWQNNGTHSQHLWQKNSIKCISKIGNAECQVFLHGCLSGEGRLLPYKSSRGDCYPYK